MLTHIQSRRSCDERIKAVQRQIYEHTNEPLNREVLAAMANFWVQQLGAIWLTG